MNRSNLLFLIITCVSHQPTSNQKPLAVHPRCFIKQGMNRTNLELAFAEMNPPSSKGNNHSWASLCGSVGCSEFPKPWAAEICLSLLQKLLDLSTWRYKVHRSR